MSEQAVDFFGDRAHAYDDFIPRLVPAYHECNDLMLDLAPFAADAPVRVLDVGAGTGILAALAKQRFPRAHITVNDISEAMLAICAGRFEAIGAEIEQRQGRFPDVELGNGYDLVLSSLALHHLPHADKRRGFAKLFDAMSPGGTLIIRDVVAAATPALVRRYTELWRTEVQAHGYDDMSWFDEHLDEDNPATVEDQTRWLSEIGFEDVGCHWRYLNCAMFGGRKPDV